MGVSLDTPVQPPPTNPIRKVTYDQAKDEVTATMPAATFKEAQTSMDFRNRAMVAMQTEADRIGAQEQQARSRNPILGAIQEIGARLSQQKDMPGFVQGLGQASMAMNPNADDLARQKLPLYMQLAKMEEENQKLATDQERLRQADLDRQTQLRISQQNADTAAVSQKTSAANMASDNFRADLTPIHGEVKATGIFGPDQEDAIRKVAEGHPEISKIAVEGEVAKAKANAAAAASEIQRRTAQRQRDMAQRAAIDAQNQAGREGRQINVAVVKSQLAQADRIATQSRLDPKLDAPRLQSLNELAIVNKRMRERLESDPLWQGPLVGPIAEKTYLTTSQQAMLADQAKAFIAKMGIAGLSFAKTSDAEMKKILASVVNNKMTVAMAKQTLDIIDAEGQRAAIQIARDKWATSPEDMAARMPDIYRDAAIQALDEQRSRLNGRQRLALGLATGDEGLVSGELGQITGSLPGRSQPATNSTRPGELRMARPVSDPSDPHGILGLLPKR